MSTTIVNTIVSPSSYTPLYISTQGLVEKDTDGYKPGEIFSFVFEDDYVYVVSEDGYYLTCNLATRTATWYKVYNKSTIGDSSRFNYYLNNKTIILFVYNSLFKKIIRFTENDFASISNIAIDATSFPDDSIIHIDILEDKINVYKHLLDSFTVKYNTQNLDNVNTLESVRSSDYNQNILFNIPLDSAEYLTYINSLKNYYTSTYDNSIYPTLNSSVSSVHRDYTNIFTGSNQSGGYENLYINFISNTLNISMSKDTETFFTAPAIIESTGIPISSSSLFYDGAVAGTCPFISDRIAFNAKDYRENFIPTAPADIIDGTWQYTWLSAGPVNNAAWMDRFYYGTNLEIDEQQNLTSYPYATSGVIDVPSTLKILPNRKYKYFHQGKSNIQAYVDKLKYIYTDSTAEILNISEWTGPTILDRSIFANNGEIVGSTDTTDLTHFKCNGANYAIFPSTPSMQEDGELYIGTSIEVEDWNNIQGNQIMGNLADGGYGLFNKQVIPTNVITLYDRYNNYFYNINSEFNVVNESYNVFPADTEDEYHIVRHSDLKFTFINITKKYFAKYDVNFNMVLSRSLDTEIDYISQVESASTEDIYLYDNKAGKIVGYDLNYTNIFNQDVSLYKYDRIEIGNGTLPQYGNVINYNNDSGDFIVGIYGDVSTIDNNNNIWIVRGHNMYKNTSYIATTGPVDQIVTDSKNNIWLTHNKSITKIDTVSEKIVFTKQIFKERPGVINFITNIISNKETDILIALDPVEKSATLLLLDGVEYNKIYLDNLKTSFFAKNNFTYTDVSFYSKGDFTGYIYQRKFKLKSEIEWKLTLTTSRTYNILAQSNISLSIPVASLQKNTKNYISLSFSTSKGYAIAYLNGEKVDEFRFTPFAYRIANSSRAFAIAANTSKQGLLSDTINLTTENKFKGKIYSLHIYKYSFNNNDIKCFFITQNDQDLYKDLKWNIKTNNRNYIEEVNKYFTFSMPGSKSKLNDIRISGFDATDSHRLLMSRSLRDLLPSFAPADTFMRDIVWV